MLYNMLVAHNVSPEGVVIDKRYSSDISGSKCLIMVESPSKFLGIEATHCQSFAVPYEKFESTSVGDIVTTAPASSPFSAVFGDRQLVETD